MAKDKEAVPEFDTDKVEALLSILSYLKDGAAFGSIKQSATMQLAVIDRELWEELYPDQHEAEKARLEEIRKYEEEAQRKREEEKEEKAA